MNLHDFGAVAVLMGGDSSEREVSLKSGAGVLAALLKKGVDAHAFDPSTRPISELVGFSRAFIALHGHYGEDGTMQGALEILRIPYTGSGVAASAFGMDKWRTKLIWKAVGLPVPDFVLLDDLSNPKEIAHKLGFPIFVKPACEGSSMGVIKVSKPEELMPAWHLAHQLDDCVLAEEAILGGEYTVAIISEGTHLKALPIVKIEPATDFYDYEAKYVRNDTRYLCPSGLPASQEKKIQDEAIRAFRALGCRGWGRIDFLMDHENRHYFLEANTSPGMTDHSLVPMAAKTAGMSYEDLVLHLLSQASLG